MNEPDSTREPPFAQSILEALVLLLLLFLFAGGEPSATDESHYLAKAKHYWNPAWCPSDYFLNSRDAHVGFYWTFGWLANIVSLPAAAWLGRVIVWTFQAIAWQRLSMAVVPRKWFSLLSLGVYLALMKHTHMAREWAIGDVEGKTIAWGFVFLGLAQLLRGRWKWVWPLFGAGAAFHVLVGGWAVVAGMFAWVALSLTKRPDDEAPTLNVSVVAKQLPALALGFVLSLPGLIPSLLLNVGTPKEIVSEGNVAYVFVRLSHHLVFHRFETWMIARHAAIVLVAVLLMTAFWRVERLRPLFAFGLGAITLAIIGVALDYAMQWQNAELAASVLRFYWYRLSDAVTPLVVTFALTWNCGEAFATRKAAQVVLTSLLAILAGANIVWIVTSRMELGVPESQRSLVRNEKTRGARRAVHNDWLAACNWIASKTPPDAIVLTPRFQQTFKWYSGRGEVFTWKDAPQDGAGMTEWLRRYQDIDHPDTVILHPPETDPSLPREERLLALARTYGASLILIDRRQTQPLTSLPLVYPRSGEFNASFAVYAVPKQ